MIWLAYALIALAFAALFTREVIAPASRARCDRRWQILATSLNVVQLVAVVGIGAWLGDLLPRHSLFDVETLVGPVGGAVLTFLAASLVAYWWHRAAHRSTLLWRLFHQLHHSPSRIEAHTAFFVHPLDAAAATLITGAIGYGLFGIGASGMALALLLAGLFNLVIHMDVSTPRWMGWFVQRPEMHRVHHQRGHHADNYGLPMWDLLFGTWRNPTAYVEQCGFDDDKAARLSDMLLFRDVHSSDGSPGRPD